MSVVKKYLAEIGGRGGRAGRGAAKARTHAQAVAAGRKGGKATAANRRARLNPTHLARPTDEPNTIEARKPL